MIDCGADWVGRLCAIAPTAIVAGIPRRPCEAITIKSHPFIFAMLIFGRYRHRLQEYVPVGEGSELEIGQSGDASTRVLLPPLAPQDALTQVEQSPMPEYEPGLKRQLPILHRDFTRNKFGRTASLARVQGPHSERRCRRRRSKDVRTCLPQQSRPSGRDIRWLRQESTRSHALALGRRLLRSGATPDRDELRAENRSYPLQK
jgi:hypothetical protein